MKCPKCQYLSFEPADRCRNCGYEFSLAPEALEIDLPIRTGDEPVGPLADFALGDPATPDRPEEDSGSRAPRRSTRAGRAAIATPADLPLFGAGREDDDAPLVSVPATPRAPVAVRKSSVATRPARRPDEPELELVEPWTPSGGNERHSAAPAAAQTVAHSQQEATDPAPIGSRLMAALVDGLLLGSIDWAVLYLTLMISGLTMADVALVPLPPFLAFLALLNGGYFVIFTTAGGQTIGKMVAGIRVVSADAGSWTDRVTLAQAVIRSASYLASALPLGFGFLPAVASADRRALHDRIARTRVVRA